MSSTRQTTLLLCLVGLFSVLGQASEIDYGQLSFNGSRGAQSLSLQTETMRTEYRWIQVPYQQQVCRMETRYRRVCRQEPPRQVCRDVNRPICRERNVCRVVNNRRICQRRRVCRDRRTRICRNVPGRNVCRQVPYQQRVCRTETRYRQERRAYQVIDGRTYASLSFNFNIIGERSGIRTDINASLERTYLTLRSEDFSSPRRALVGTVINGRAQRGRDLHISNVYNLNVIKADELFKPINELISANEINQGIINFGTGLISHPSNMKLRLRISSGALLLDRELNMNEYRLVNSEGRTQVELNLLTLLGGDYTGREFGIEFSIRVPQESLLNKNQFSKFENRTSIRRVWR